MKGYRNIYRCPECGKIGAKVEELTNDACSLLDRVFGVILCKHCGKVIKPERVAGKPKLFGLLGWDIKEGKEWSKSAKKSAETKCLEEEG